jgi:hypothetical protein
VRDPLLARWRENLAAVIANKIKGASTFAGALGDQVSERCAI